MVRRTVGSSPAAALAVCLVCVGLGCSDEESSQPVTTATSTGTGTGGTGAGGASGGTGGVAGGGGAGGEAAGLPQGIYELDGLDVELPYDDLAPLAAIVGDAPVVALGESVHTSGGYYQAKHRLFRYLVEELGFRSYAFESPWAAADLVADYVNSCQGSAEDAIAQGLFGVWASQSVLDSIEWMCAYNQANPADPVHFFGFDIQQPWVDGPALMSFLTQVAPADAPALNADLVRCKGANTTSEAEFYNDPLWDVVDPIEHQACVAGLAATEQYFVDHEAAIVAASSAEALEWARIHFVGLRAFEGQQFYFDSDDPASLEARDYGMAYVFQKMWELRHPNDKVVLWAHNTHIARRGEQIDGLYYGGRDMGSFLDEALGADYLPVGLIGYQISINWPGVHVGDLEPHEGVDQVEAMLHALGRDYLLVDLAFPGADTPFLEPGATYGVSWDRLVPADQFNALVFLDVSPMMDALYW